MRECELVLLCILLILVIGLVVEWTFIFFACSVVVFWYGVCFFW